MDHDFPLVRDLNEPLPATPPNLPLDRLPTIGTIRVLLPPTLLAEFEQALAQCPTSDLQRFVEHWGTRAVGLHDTDLQHLLE